MRITVLAGGVGAARFLRGLKQAAPDAEITVIGNTGDDITLFGLRVCPDLDTVMYTLGGGINEEQGWGRAEETFTVRAELAAYGASPDWFTLGDRDFATHILRSQLLASGLPLSAVTAALCERWQPGVELLPMSDDRVETHVVLDEGRRPGATVHFQEWWVRLHAADARGGDHRRRRRSRPHPRRACSRRSPRPTWSLFPPSNPVVSIGTILAVPGITGGGARPRPWSACPPIIGGAPVRGMADACLTAIGVADHGRGGRGALRAGADQRLAGRRPGQGRGRRPGAGRDRGPRPAAATCATCPPPPPSPGPPSTWPWNCGDRASRA